MANQIIWSLEAEKDFNSILHYLARNWEQEVVSKFIDKIESQILLISREPYLFPLIHKKLAIRKSVVTKQNTLYYRVKNNSIEIIRLFDSRQDPDKLVF